MARVIVRVVFIDDFTSNPNKYESELKARADRLGIDESVLRDAFDYEGEDEGSADDNLKEYYVPFCFRTEDLKYFEVETGYKKGSKELLINNGRTLLHFYDGEKLVCTSSFDEITELIERVENSKL